jgi:hypothetical protein
MPLCVSLNNIKLNNFNGIASYYNKFVFEYDKKCQSNIELIDKIKSIQNHIIDHFINNYDMDIPYLESLKNKNIYLYVSTNTKIIKLGSNSEDNINTYINSFDEFNKYISNKFYNKYNSDRYYLANLLLSFNLIIYRYNETETWKLSIKPYIKNIEFKFSKSITISKINTHDNILLMSNNILSI